MNEVSTSISALCDEVVRLRDVNKELLEAMKTVRHWMIPGMNWTDEIGQEIVRTVDAAIAKAEGRS